MPTRPILRWLVPVLLFVPCLPHAASAAKAARQVPSLTLRTASGAVALDSLRGKVVVVDFWASWCGPCRQSFPWLDSLQTRYRERGVVVIGVSVDKTLDAADAFVAGHPAGFTVAYDPAGRAAEAFGVQGMPTTFLVGRDGTLLASHVGFEPRKTAPFESALQEACAR